MDSRHECSASCAITVVTVQTLAMLVKQHSYRPFKIHARCSLTLYIILNEYVPNIYRIFSVDVFRSISVIQLCIVSNLLSDVQHI